MQRDVPGDGTPEPPPGLSPGDQQCVTGRGVTGIALPALTPHGRGDSYPIKWNSDSLILVATLPTFLIL